MAITTPLADTAGVTMTLLWLMVRKYVLSTVGFSQALLEDVVNCDAMDDGLQE